MGNDILLLCDEDRQFLSSPSHSPSNSRACSWACTQSPSSSSSSSDEIANDEEVLRNYLQREPMYRPRSDYLEHLQLSTNLASARARAIRWIIMVQGRLGLGLGTLFAAINYLDRFISMNCYVWWEVWMIELISIACLSIASKVDEVFIPLLHDFQTDDLDHIFQPNTIERMELAILKALDWRVTCITPYSYMGLLIRQLGSHHTALTTRTTKFLLRSLLEVKFVECSAITIAISAIKCALEELIPLDSDAYLQDLEQLLAADRKAEIDKCHRMMEEQISNVVRCPKSPVTVIPLRKTEVLDCYVNIDKCFFHLGQDFNSQK